MIPGPVTLLILDGFGDGPRNAFDATFVQGMPRVSALRRTYAATQLVTSGEAGWLTRWSVRSFVPAPGFRGALVAEGGLEGGLTFSTMPMVPAVEMVQ